MADYEYCGACEELRERDPNLIVNGFSEKNCDHMQVDEGLTGETDDFEDLNTMNDCLIGIMDAESEVRDVCGWRDYIQNFIPNLWTMLKAMICAIGGLWTAVKSYQLEEDDGDIVLTAWDGEHGRVDIGDSDTTYSLSKSGNKIILTDSNSHTDEVTDDNTTYTLSGSGNTVTLTGSDGSTSSHTVTGGGGGYTVVRRQIASSEYVEHGATATLSVAVNESGYNLIGVLGYNINDATSIAGQMGVAHFNVFAIEPHSTEANKVYVQMRNESANDVIYDMWATCLYAPVS